MKFSIITVNYNNAIGLQNTIESVVKQTFKDYEHIIIDGGSTDGSKDIILRYQDNFSYWCCEPDKGIYNAMNKGVAHANGDYLLFLNSGDVLHNADVLYDINQLGDEVDVILGLVMRMDNKEMHINHEPSVVLQLVRSTISHQGAFFKKTIFNKHQYNESLKIVSDWQLFCEVLVFDNHSYLRTSIIVADMDMTGISHDTRNRSLLLQERENVLKSLFPSMVLQDLKDYSNLYKYPLFEHLVYLKDEHFFLFTIFRRFIKLLYLLLKKMS